MKNINTVILIILFLFSPFLGFFFTLYILRQNYRYTHFLSFFMGLCAILFPPYADLYRHTLTYFSFCNEDSGWLISFFGNSDFLLTWLSYLFAKGNISFEFIRFLFVFICYEIYFALFKYYAFQNKWLQAHQRNLFAACLITFMLVPFIWIVNGLRQVTACTVILWAFHLVFERHKRYGWLFALLGPCIHFSTLAITVVMFLSGFFRPGKKWAIFFMLLALGAGYFLSSMALVSIENDFIGKNVDYYMNRSAEVFDESRSLSGYIAYYLEKLPFFPLVFWIMISKRIPGYVYNVMILTFFCFPFSILFARIVQFTLPLLYFMFLKWEWVQKRDSRLLRVIFYSSLITLFAYGYGYREPLLNGRFYKLLFPMPISLVNTYSLEWINENLDVYGEFK